MSYNHSNHIQYNRKYIEFDFLPIKINRKYKIAINQIPKDTKVVIFNKYQAAISLCKNWFGKVNAMIIFEDIEVKNEIFKKLVTEFGQPKFVSFSNLNIWMIDDLYLSFGEKELHLNDTRLVIEISLIKPLVRMKYNEFLDKTFVLRNIVKSWNVEFVFEPVVQIDKTVMCSYHSDLYQYTIYIKKNRLEIFSQEKKVMDDGIHFIPGYNRKHKFESQNELEILIDSFFEYMEKDDSTLSRKKI